MAKHLGTSLVGLLVALILFLGESNVEAQITYIDAVEGAAGNTFATGGSLADTSWIDPDTGSAADEDQWKKRGSANNGTVFQARHTVGDGDDMPELTTQITGLSDGNYNIWAYFWDTVDGGLPNTWTLSAGLTSGSLATYSFDGPGNNGVTAASTQTFTVTPLTNDGNNTMYGINLGAVNVSGGSDINVYLDNLVGGGSSTRTWYDGVGYEISTTPFLEATVDRDTGVLSISNTGGGAASIIGYSYTSATGSLDQTGWTSVADNGDANSGGSIDPDDDWIVLTAPDVHTDLSEAQLDGAGPGDGFSLASLASLSFGAPWIKSSTEDVQLQVLMDNGSIVQPVVQFVGNSGNSFIDGDFDFDNDIDSTDYAIFLTGLHEDLSGLSLAEAYQVGDMNGDLANDFSDVLLFETAYDDLNGSGAFAAMASAVPEPGALSLLLIGALFMISRRRSNNLNCS